MNKDEQIIHLAKEQNGFLWTNQVIKENIRVETLNSMVKRGRLEKISHGLYALPNVLLDEYFLLQQKCSKGVFSYGTALYFLELSNRVPNIIHLTVHSGYNTRHITKTTQKVNFHYVKKEILELGKTTILSPQGHPINSYNAERTLCDLIKHKKKMDMQLFGDAVKFYFESKKKNIRRLMKYAKQMGIEDKVRTYTEVIL
jgi:predicted transcriptional regulator of viral defense system